MDIKKRINGERIDLIFEEFVPANPNKKFVDCVTYNVVLHSTNKKIGHCSAKLGFNDTIFYIGNIGYNIDENFRGNGYAGEAVTLLLEVFKKNGFKKIYITNIPENNASRRVCEKLGAKFLGSFEIPVDNIRRKEFGEKLMNIFEIDLH